MKTFRASNLAYLDFSNCYNFICGCHSTDVTRILESVKEQMHQEIAQKLTATDSIIKDSIGKMYRSKVG